MRIRIIEEVTHVEVEEEEEADKAQVVRRHVLQSTGLNCWDAGQRKQTRSKAWFLISKGRALWKLSKISSQLIANRSTLRLLRTKNF